MAKGKNTDNETIYKIMLSVFSTNNCSETSRQLNIPTSTVEKIFKENKDKPEFAILWEQKKDEFVASANRIINKGTKLLEQRLNTALENQDELEELIYDIYNADKEEIREQQKKALVQKIMRMQINSLSEITTAIGTLYDKKRISESGTIESNTPNVQINIVDGSNLEKSLYEEDND